MPLCCKAPQWIHYTHTPQSHTHTRSHAGASICPTSSHGWPLEAIRPRALSGATSCLHRAQRHSCSRFPLSAKRTPIKSTVPQLEFGRIHLVGCSKSLCLTSFSHVAPFLESVTEKMRLVISCNRILLGFFVFLWFPPNMFQVHLVLKACTRGMLLVRVTVKWRSKVNLK